MPKKMNQKSFTVKANVSGHYFTIVSVQSIAKAFAQTKLLLGYSSLSSNQTPSWVAKEEGFYKRFGVDADLILIEGSTRGAQALISGDLPIIGMAGQAIISARARGADLVAVAGVVNKMNYIVVGSPWSQKPGGSQGQTDRYQPDRHGFLSCGSTSVEAMAPGRTP